MSDEEALAFLDEQRTVICATNGRDGWPHLMPLWYVVRDDELWSWTYASSQKVRNIERDPQATVQVEAGTEYQELRGVMFKCEVELIRDTEDVAALGMDIFGRYGGVQPEDLGDQVREMVLKQATKRVGLHFTPEVRLRAADREEAARELRTAALSQPSLGPIVWCPSRPRTPSYRQNRWVGTSRDNSVARSAEEMAIGL